MAGRDHQEHHVTIEMQRGLDKRFLELESAGNYDIMPNKAGKVPLFMKNHPNLRTYFEPSFVSFGPVHYGKPQYHSAEKYKLRLANYFVKDSGEVPYILYQKVEDNCERLMQYFDEEVAGYDKQDLAWMLFVDGCAVLQSIFCVVQVTFEELKIEHDKMALWEQDLFLLENQLPYQLLLDLMDSSAKKDELRTSIKAFINKHSVALHSYNQKEPERPVHILDYLWQILVHEEIMNQQYLDPAMKRYLWPARRQYQSIPWRHNVQELKTAGINVKPNKGTLTDIFIYNLLNFGPGYLSIPPVVVDYTTGFKLVNLIAYEMTRPGMSNYNGVISYVLFLGSILDGTGDVKELMKARVLYNFLDKEDEVFQLFKDISTNLMPLQIYNEFHVNVKRQIDQHYGNKYRIWMARLFQQTQDDLFSRPWKIVVFFGSFSLLLLTATQTLYPILNPSGHGEDQVRKKFI